MDYSIPVSEQVQLCFQKSLGAGTKASFKPFFIHILPIISPSQAISADNKSMQSRQPNDPNLYPAGLAAVEQIMQQLTATRESLQSGRNLS